jgi:hypothetical protein
MKKSMKPERYIWNERDFNDLGWHDNRIRALLFEQDFVFSLSLDYIYKWEKNFKGYWVAPAKLSFQNVSDLEINISFLNMSDLIAEDISRSKKRNTPNGLLIENEYVVKTNVGSISFFSTGFELELKQDPEFSQSQDIHE